MQAQLNQLNQRYARGDLDETICREHFVELSRRVRDAGLMTRRSGDYAVRITATVAALSALVVTGVIIGDSWWNLTIAIGLAFVLAQLGFIGHDAGHRQLSRRRQINDVIGMILSNLLVGFSFGWWLNKHSRHHAHTNQPGRDPDIAAGALVYTREQMMARAGLGEKLARAQAVFLMPLLLLEAVNMHQASLRSLMRRRDRMACVEGVLLTAHILVFFVGPFFVLDPIRAVTFVALTESGLGFYLGATFVTNHVGMPTREMTAAVGFLRQQVLTSRNLRGTLFTSFLFGGLDSQIEHHLFPAMPRGNLRRARGLVRLFCDEHFIAYAEQSPWRAYRDVFHHLLVTGASSAA
jgi:fatty acid desaturase